ncbi:MAG: retroviral-like aspartic protease family protein [Lachnospiraceae bacterium]|nr:retroviral-like aspartic protease family protein [Lachnospiraceae bacterium]
MAYSLRRTLNGFVVPCVLSCDVPVLRQFLFDTGAAASVLSLNYLKNLRLIFTGKISTFSAVSGHKIIARQIQLSQFTVSDIDLGTQRLWVLPDVKDTALLGRDILSQIDFQYLSKDDTLYLRSIKESLNVNMVNCESVLSSLLINRGMLQNKEHVRKLLPDTIDMPYVQFVQLVDKILCGV